METQDTMNPAHTNTESEAPISTAETSHDFDPRKALDLKALESLRAEQREAYAYALQVNLDKGVADQVVTLRAHEAVLGTINEYLEQNNLSPDNENHVVYQDALLDLSIVTIPESEWYAKFEDEETQTLGQSGRDKTRDYYQKLTGKSYYNEADTQVPDADVVVEPEALTNEEVDPLSEAKSTLDTRRENLARLSAKRQGTIFGKNETYDEALEEYNEQVIALGKLETKDILADETLTDVEKNAKVIEYLFAEQNKLRAESMEKMANTKVSQFINKFSEFMKRGNKAQRIAKGVVIGAGLGVVVAAAAGIGGGVAAVAGAAAVGVKLGRAYAIQDAKAGRGIGKLDESAKAKAAYSLRVTGASESDDVFDQLQGTFNNSFEGDIKNEQKKRRVSMYKAAGTVAIGAAIGSTIHILAESGVFEGGNAPAPTPEASIPPTPPEGGDALGTPPAEIPAPLPEILPDPSFVVDSGEGGISFFQDMGLTEGDWYSVANELAEKFPNDFRPEGNDIWISHPGQLSLEAQEYIKTRFSMS